jgi:hypothetical protein
MPQSNRIILTDVDGVLLDWEKHFSKWMISKGYQQVADGKKMYSMVDRYGIEKPKMRKLTTEFNNSAWMGTQEPMPNSQTWVKLLHAEGWTFIPITSQTTDIPAQQLRKWRLKELFGGTVFSNFIILPTGDDKDSALAEFHGTGLWWVEDKPENAEAGLKFGLKSMLYDHLYNKEYNNPNVKRVSNWEHIYKIVNEKN